MAQKKASKKAAAIEVVTTAADLAVGMEAAGEGYTTDAETGAIEPEKVIEPEVDPKEVDGANDYNVPPKQWAKWNDAQKAMFESMYSSMRLSQSTYNAHPLSVKISDEQWMVIAWNVAWNAADCV